MVEYYGVVLRCWATAQYYGGVLWWSTHIRLKVQTARPCSHCGGLRWCPVCDDVNSGGGGAGGQGRECTEQKCSASRTYSCTTARTTATSTRSTPAPNFRKPAPRSRPRISGTHATQARPARSERCTATALTRPSSAPGPAVLLGPAVLPVLARRAASDTGTAVASVGAGCP